MFTQFLNQSKSKIAMWSLSSALLLTTVSCGKDSGKNIEIDGIKGPTLTLLQNDVVISVVFENIQLEGGLKYNIPKLENSSLEIIPDTTTQGTKMNLTFSIKDIVSGKLETLDPQKLPGGRNLPGVAQGSLPAVAFSVEKFHNMKVYAGKELFGVFIPTNVGIDNTIASFRYYANDKKMGTISLVGKDELGENSGILLLLDLKANVKNLLVKRLSQIH